MGDNSNTTNQTGDNGGIAIYCNKVKLDAGNDLLHLENDLANVPKDKNNFFTVEKNKGILIVTYCIDKNMVLPKGVTWEVKTCPTDNYSCKQYCPSIKNHIQWRINTLKGNIDAMIDRVFNNDFKSGGPLVMSKMGMRIKMFMKDYPWSESESNALYLTKITNRFEAKKWNAIVIKSCTQSLRESVVKFATNEETKITKFKKWLLEPSIPHAYEVRNLTIKKIETITSQTAKAADYFENLVKDELDDEEDNEEENVNEEEKSSSEKNTLKRERSHSGDDNLEPPKKKQKVVSEKEEEKD